MMLAALAGLALASPAGAATANQPTACPGAEKLVANVTYTLFNDYDSGVAGNAWANDTIDRHLQVWQTEAGSYCALVNDNGSFTTFAGSSPGGTGSVEAGIDGVIKGGYVVTFSGTLDTKPAYATHGNLGSFDLKCSSAYACGGAHPSYLSYASGISNEEWPAWEWKYHTARNGDWVNALSGNSGDITG